MKIRISFRPFVNYILYVKFNRGYYTINYATSTVTFSPGKPPKNFENHLSKTCVVDFQKSFTHGDAKIIHLCELPFINHGYKYVIDFIKGSLPQSSCNSEVAYLSVEPPFEGKLYFKNEPHETFSGQTICVKREDLDV